MERQSRQRQLVNNDAFGSKFGDNAVDNGGGEQHIAWAYGSGGDSNACDIAG